MHVNYVEFYSSEFSDLNETKKFIEKVENSETKAKIVIHQCARLLWLAEKVEEVAVRRPAFQIMFYLIAAEAISKIVFDYKGNNSSKRYVRRFFEEICLEKHHKKLSISFLEKGKYLNLTEVINYLYKIRCDVVHEGKYYEVNFNDDNKRKSVIASSYNINLRVYISHKEIRQIILEGALIGAKRILANNYPLNK